MSSLERPFSGSNPQTPLELGTPLPHRKELRSWLLPLSQRVVAYPLLLLAMDYTLLAACLAGAMLAPWALLQVLCGVLAGLVIGRIFIIGHDACHQSLTPHRGLNRWLGRIAFACSLTPYSLWEVGHNVVHHGFTNLKGVDFVWEPLTAQEYAALSPSRQRLYRLYRSGWGVGAYYLIEVWWRRMFFPNAANRPAWRAEYLWDNLLALAYGLAWVGVAVWAAMSSAQSVLWVLLVAVLLPFAVWCSLIGFVVYVHHTHHDVQWHQERSAWSKAQPFVSTTVHLSFPLGLGAALHHIMEHTAHHVDMSIPLYRLRQAQAKLEEMLPGRIVIQRFSWDWFWQTVRECKLYDFERATWTDFSGQRPRALQA
jgi:acyl-lipid omega-6 desaturase (Delta-12 desaturase)